MVFVAMTNGLQERQVYDYIEVYFGSDGAQAEQKEACKQLLKDNAKVLVFLSPKLNATRIQAGGAHIQPVAVINDGDRF